MKFDICPICKSNDTIELYSSTVDVKKLSFTYVKTSDSGKTFRSVKCLNCSHVFCSPLPKNLYKNYEDVVDKKYLHYVESISESARIILPMIKRYIPKGKILDVGCATGEFLSVARDFGYTVEGLELSKWSSDITKSKKIKVHRCLLRSMVYKNEEKYDVITLFGVIEHFEKPREEMECISKLLRPGGLVVVWTGDVSSISSKILKHNWWYWQGQHIQYFSSRSLNLLGKNYGLKHVTTKIFPFAGTYGLVENSLSRYRIKSFLVMFLKPLFLLKAKWIIYLPGEMLWFATKST
ncbi:MAG: hypothetical protein CO135_02515 [Candidatus Levybacteria bacterium CG_4_9_14_3_um_filter_35_16]|nr:MAG: hypothetical protein COW87_04395 [Candidatus Levybacteria bacterium CG22_combo_CG10-13_8_21_14_all_35_11]PIY94768.1 MAG: hypothetical protein COY68_01275 [Candidatus Levybacteria bacterium CG_4_10_14_0_8_um_filter_35_23]PJA91221.1 MAG: hypothetical protein CO135_02515 [Candidatus Levybacteria bacterium CG_4_9_14_3_um_filter_35_16]PJC54847.1 MAG: hypothetical protein CO028_00125 [Candidatus Levybacteria bacterium CG_4_9_14_0_2_um_filter_35_21]